MQAHAGKSPENTSKAVAHSLPKLNVNSESSGFADNRSETIAQRKLQAELNDRAETKQQKTQSEPVHTNPADHSIIQMASEDDIAAVALVVQLSAADRILLAAVHNGMNVAGLTLLAQSDRRTLSDRVDIANGTPLLTGGQVCDLAGVRNTINVQGLILIGLSQNRSLADRIAIAAGAVALTAAQVCTLAGVRDTINVEGLIVIALSQNRSLADRIAIAAGAVALTAAQVCAVASIHDDIIDVEEAIQIALSQHRTLAQRIALANGAAALTAAQVCALAGVHNNISVQDLILIAQPTTRTLANKITIANTYPALTAGEIILAAAVAVGDNLSNTIITNLAGADVAAIQDATTAERQAVLANGGLRAIVRTAANAPLRMSSLLKGSQHWRNPISADAPQFNDFYTYFIQNDGNGQLPNDATMNCWESVLYAFYLAGRKTAANIQAFYQAAQDAGLNGNSMIWQQLGYTDQLTQYVADVTMPAAGQVVYYKEQGEVDPGHIALSLGGNYVMSLWSKPNDIDVVQRILINALHVENDTIRFGNLA